MVGCTQPKSSAERHARQFIYATQGDHVPYFRTSVSRSARLLFLF
ncbi:Exc2 family lipoprotein [Xenorhabdus szentirmaii]|uniref:Exc2 n=2 Tax=Xenorhabdus szentirmaii TaxID=290112 RepID=W1IWC9_9GAMM